MEKAIGKPFVATAFIFAVCLPLLSSLYGIAAASLFNMHVMSFETIRLLFEKRSLLIAHVPILLLAAVIAYTYSRWQSIIRSSRMGAFMWTIAAVSGHVLAAIFC